MTTGQRVIPKVALDGGYQFRFPQLDSALRSILTPAQASEVPS
jgi:NAD dependent epimerase/dehydratase family enzyme